MRVLKVLALLLALGGVSGALVGVSIAFVLFHGTQGVEVAGDLGLYGAAALAGALVGALTGWPIAFTLLRRVPLWRATVQVAGAAGLGAAVGMQSNVPFVWPVAALVMALAMALWLRYQYRNRPEAARTES